MSGDKAVTVINQNSSLEVLDQSFIVERVKKLQEIKDKIMDEDVHYGTIPGCGSKPALLKEGAELLCMAFQLCPTYEVTVNDLPRGHREYEYEGFVTYIPTGAVIAHGVGICSTMESKYRWREGSKTCPNCGQEAIIKGKEEYGGGWLCFAKKGGCGAKFKDGDQTIEGQKTGRVENPDIADQYNTVKKIGKKRCQSDMVLTATGASFLFSQADDLPPDPNQDDKPQKEPMTPPKSKSEGKPQGEQEKPAACPSCKKPAFNAEIDKSRIIPNKYGDEDWLCWKKNGGCGHKFDTDTQAEPATPEDELAKNNRHMHALFKDINPKMTDPGKRVMANKFLKIDFPNMEELKSLGALTAEQSASLIAHLKNTVEEAAAG